MVYSREMRKMVYFEVYGNRVVMYGNRRYYSYDAVSLSSFRPVEVLVPRSIAEKLKEEYVRKFVVFRITSNETLVLNMEDSIVNIYDRKTLKRLTGKEGTVPERLYMRVRTLRRVGGRALLIHWTEILSYEWNSLTILALYAKESGLGMKMIRGEARGKMKDVLKLLPYIDGYLIIHGDMATFVPRSDVSKVRYRDIAKAVALVRGRQEMVEEEFEYEEEDAEEGGITLW